MRYWACFPLFKMTCVYTSCWFLSNYLFRWMLKLIFSLFLWYFLQLRTFRGHTNEKNFVGLTVNSEYIACGSETNEVFVYHKVPISSYISWLVHLCWLLINLGLLQAICKPAAWHKFSSDTEEADEDTGSYFISAVCWKSDSPTMVTANSQGTIKVLVLAPWFMKPKLQRFEKYKSKSTYGGKNVFTTSFFSLILLFTVVEKCLVYNG